MSQAKVTSFYVARKSSRIQSNKAGLDLKNVDNLSEDVSVKLINQELIKKVKNESKGKSKSKLPKNEHAATVIETVVEDTQKKPQKRKGAKAKSTTKKGSKAAVPDLPCQTKVTSYYESSKKGVEARKLLKAPDLSICNEECEDLAPPSTSSENASELQNIDVKETTESDFISKTIHSPKRNLINAYEGTPPKKKQIVSTEEDTENTPSPSKCSKMTPKKLVFTQKEDTVSSPSKDVAVAKRPVVNIQNKSEETRKAIANFKGKLALIKNYEANPYKVTAVISPSDQCEKKSAIPAIPAYQRYTYLADSELFALPLKYKVLSEMFRSMDTVISILNNRKEKIIFEKVKEGVQKMMKRNFSKTHLGQIVTVMPNAFDICLEKCSYKKASDPDYELIINPVLKAPEGKNSKAKSKAIVTMTPQDLLERKTEFNSLLLNIVKKHHTVFLNRINFSAIPTTSITRWHPKFQVDAVAEIEVAQLPELPEVKICTAKDVLNKIMKGSLRHKNRIVKALQSVGEETITPTIKKTELEANANTQKLPTSKEALKGVCSDLIAKIRARESAKLLECMTESPDEVKRKAMRERLPKIVQILWHYFIAERKAAIPVDSAVEKIIHSCNSLSTHEEVKAHLTLITETFPGWLSFIQIPKGIYITMDKNKNITEMLDNFHC